MAKKCPIKSSSEWQRLVAGIGENQAYRIFIANGEEVPAMDTIEQIIATYTPEARAEKDVGIEQNAINYLSGFLSDIGVKPVAVTNPTAKGVPVDAIADITHRLIKYSQGKLNAGLLAHETGHFIVDGLGTDHPLIKPMFDIVGETVEYDEVVSKYSDVYDGDKTKLQKEAIGQILGKYIIEGQSPISKSKSVTDRLKRLMDMIILRVKQLFGRANSDQLKKRMDEIFGRAAEAVKQKEIREQIKEGLTEGEYYSFGKKFKEAILGKAQKIRDVEIHSTDDIIRDIENVIERLRMRRAKKGIEEGRKIDILISQREEKLKEIKESREQKVIIDLAIKDIKYIGEMVDTLQKDTSAMPLVEKEDLFSLAAEVLPMWVSAGEWISSISPENRKWVAPMIGEARSLFHILFGASSGLAGEFIGEQVGAPDNEKLFSMMYPVGWAEYMFLDPSVGKNTIMHKSFNFANKRIFQASKRYEELVEQSDEIEKNFREYLRSRGQSYDDFMEDVFMERYADGKKTGDYVDKISPEYYKEYQLRVDRAVEAEKKLGKSAAWKPFYVWKDKNVDYSIKPEYYEEENAKREELTGSDGKMSDANKDVLEDWIILHRPYINDGKYVWSASDPISKRYVKWEPKESLWGSKQYKRIRTEFAGTPAERAYDFLIYSIQLYKNMYPDSRNMGKPNFMPDIKISAIKDITRNGLGAFFNHLGDKLKAQWKEGFFRYTAPIEGKDTVYDEIGFPMKNVPIYTTFNALKPEEKSTDMFKALKMLASQALVYDAKTDVEDTVRLTHLMIRNATMQEEVTTENDLDRYVRGTGGAAGSNLVKQFENWMDSTLYNRVKDPVKVGRYDLRKVTDMLTMAAVWKYLGLSIFSPTLNFIMGSAYILNRGASGLDYSIQDAHLGLWYALWASVPGDNQFFTQVKSNIPLIDEGVKVRAWAKRLGINTQDISAEFVNGSAQEWVNNLLMFMMKGSEHTIRWHGMMAVLLHEKVTNKKGDKISLFNAFKLKDGKLVWDEDNFSEEESHLFLDREYAIKAKVEDVNAGLNGAYGLQFTIGARKYIISSLLSLFKMFIFRTFFSKFAGRRWNPQLGREWEGSMTAIGKWIFNGFQGDYITQKTKWEGIANLSVWAGLTGAIILLKGIEVDEDDPWEMAAWKVMLRTFQQVKDDLLSYFIVSDSLQSKTTSLFPQVAVLTDIYDAFALTFQAITGDDMMIKTGVHKGKSKLVRAWERNIPGWYGIRRAMEAPKIPIKGMKKAKKKKYKQVRWY